MPNKFAKLATFVSLTARDGDKARRPLQRRYEYLMPYIFLFLTIFSIPITSLALSLGQTHWKLDKAELEAAGFMIQAYADKSGCQSTDDVYVEVPKEFKGRKFYDGSLTLKHKDQEQLSLNLNIVEAERTLYSEKPFHGVWFCLDRSKASDVTLRFHYGIFIKSKFGVGDHITEVVKINGLDKWLD
jgi:hypothetical protein